MKIQHNTLFFAVLILSLGFFQNHGCAQDKSWEWAVPIYSKASNAGYSIVADNTGNTYVAGSFADTLHIGDKTLVSKGFTDIFIAAFNDKGDIKWLRQAGGTDSDEAYGISLDNAGNVYATGYFSGSVDFSGQKIKSVGSRDFFVTKYDPDGNVVWVRNGTVSVEDYANFVCTDDAGDVFISGVYHGTMYIGNSVFKSKNHKDLFVIKYNTGGDLQWIKVGGGDEKDEISAIHADGEGNLYLTGTFEKELLFDKMLIESTGKKDIFLAKYNPEGMIRWIRKGGSSTGDATSTAIELDSVGNIYISGYFSGIASFESKSLKSAGADDIFLAKYDPKGVVLWAKQSGGHGNEHAHALIMDPSGNVYLAGEFDYSFSFAQKNLEKSGDWDIFVLRYHEDGGMAGSSQISGPGFKKATSLAIDKAGNAYLLGYFIQQATLGDLRMKAPGQQGCGFIAKMKHFAGN